MTQLKTYPPARCADWSIPSTSRASVSDDHTMMVDVGKVLDRMRSALERIDNDLDTPISIEDVAGLDELAGTMQIVTPAVLLCHVTDTAKQIMATRYPLELIATPFPDQYDPRLLTPLQLDDEPCALAKRLFDQRMAVAGDLDPADFGSELSDLELGEAVQVFVALIVMFGHKLSGLKYVTGTP